MVIIVPQDATQFPNLKQYPIRREYQEGLQPLINKYLACGLLVPTNSLCNIPILSVNKKGGIWLMVQDFQIINKAVVFLHPTVPNPYITLGEIPPSAKRFTVLDFKDAFFFFFCIPLAKESQHLFAFKGEVQEKNTNR